MCDVLVSSILTDKGSVLIKVPFILNGMHQGKKQLNTTITNNNSIMEKKIYEAPMTEVMEIESEGILCGSVQDLNGNSIGGYGDKLNW